MTHAATDLGAGRTLYTFTGWPDAQPTDPTQPVQGFEVEQLGRDNFVTCLLAAALSGATLGIAYGAGRWVAGVLA